MVGNVVQRDDALYARMKQRDIDAHDSMWEPIFVDDAALGLGDSKNKVLKTFIKRVIWHIVRQIYLRPSPLFSLPTCHIWTLGQDHLASLSNEQGSLLASLFNV